jgi:hypothetical protein
MIDPIKGIWLTGNLRRYAQQNVACDIWHDIKWNSEKQQIDFKINRNDYIACCEDFSYFIKASGIPISFDITD